MLFFARIYIDERGKNYGTKFAEWYKKISLTTVNYTLHCQWQMRNVLFFWDKHTCSMKKRDLNWLAKNYGKFDGYLNGE